MELHLSPSVWAWTGKFAQTSADNEAEIGNRDQSDITARHARSNYLKPGPTQTLKTGTERGSS